MTARIVSSPMLHTMLPIGWVRSRLDMASIALHHAPTPNDDGNNRSSDPIGNGIPDEADVQAQGISAESEQSSNHQSDTILPRVQLYGEESGGLRLLCSPIQFPQWYKPDHRPHQSCPHDPVLRLTGLPVPAGEVVVHRRLQL